jgi:hypothetical protein
MCTGWLIDVWKQNGLFHSHPTLTVTVAPICSLLLYFLDFLFPFLKERVIHSINILIVCSFVSLSKPIRNELFYFKVFFRFWWNFIIGYRGPGVRICGCGIWIDHWVLGIGEVWYFSSKTAVFSRNNGFTTLCDEQHCLLLWDPNWSMDVYCTIMLRAY